MHRYTITQKTNNEKVLRHCVVPLEPHEICYTTYDDVIYSVRNHESLRQLPEINNMEYLCGTPPQTVRTTTTTTEESSQDRNEMSCPVETTFGCSYRRSHTSRCNTCSHSKLIESESNSCKLFPHSASVYDGVRCVYNVTDTRFSKCTDNAVNGCSGEVVCDASECVPRGRCCGKRDTGRCPLSSRRVGDGDSARVRADGGLRKELSMLTVLLALVAIARSKCVLLPTSSVRLWISSVMWCLLFACLCTPTAAQTNEARQEKVCQSVDIRNTVQRFQLLEDCTVVEGFVQILLIDHANETSYSNISFPKLREITGYLLLYRANGLRSIGKIFPNLAVIRGNTLFYNYALVVYEMVHLQEIGLHSLTNILRGGVRFERNPLLCYVDTIDWDYIANEAKGDLHFISGNRGQNECPMCPTSENGDGPCPKSPITGNPLCWNRHHCQKVCPKGKCSSACSANGSCCHENCLGSCYRQNSQDDCVVCKDVSFKGKCIKKCPPDTYEYMKRRCVDEAECYSMPRPKDPTQDSCQNKTWKPYKGKCLLDCPSDTEEKMSPSGKLECVPCHGTCRVECPGENVDSIASAQRLRGCTYIKGSLEIQITGGKNIVKELEDNLNMIVEIEGFLKVVRSFPLVSLNFFKSLRIIHGMHKLESDKYALVVLDNQNLQELWSPKQLENLKIKNGRIFFHFNPKLCISVIQTMSKAVGISEPITALEMAPNSNGDKMACNVTYLNASVTITTARHVAIEWNKFEHYDNRSLLGYVIYFTEAPNKNLSLYDGRDACGSDGWRVDDVGVNETTHILTHLKPYTQYAFYVKTYTIATEKNGGQSPILYFMTDPDTPSVPQSVKVYSNSSTELVLKWQPPAQPNGNVTHYIITGFRGSDEQNFLDPRNYCHEPLTHEKKPILPMTPEEEEEELKPKDTCSCEDKKEKKKLEEDEVIFANHFEDTLQNQVYVKQSQHRCPELDGNSRKRRSISSHFHMDNVLSLSPEPPLYKASANPPDINKTVYGTTAVLNDLHHFTQYLIWIEACRYATEKERSRMRHLVHVCSKPAMVTDRTLPLEGADDIRFILPSLKTLNDSRGTSGRVEISWQEPPQPNGLIVTYQIEYRRVDSENFKPTVECITRDQYKNTGYYILTGLNPGNYSLQLRATSLAGHGAYTPVTYFLIREETSLHTELIVGITTVCFLVLLMVLGILWYMRRKYKGVPNMKLIASVNPEYMSTVYVPDEWEVPRNKVELLRELGQGSFGMVYEGIATDVVEGQPKKRCAIKTVNEHATDRERSEFLNEASVMKAFNTHHVVRLLGVVSQGQPVLVIMELMTNGDLKTYLRSHRPDSNDDPTIQPPTLKRILQMAIEITDGMAYLAAKKFVHRDLAARNCMVAEDLTVKIGDFGMTRDIYETDYYRKGTKGLLPVRWMAPESLKDGVFTSRSDVWSYGVVLWEMATLASQPYQGLSNDQVLRYVIDGGVMERPENCPDRLYELMRLCWQHKPASRPSFLDLVSILLSDVAPEFQQVSFYHSAEGCELRAHMADAEQLEDDPATPLRARDLEDFTVGGSDEEEETFRITSHSPSNNYPRFISTRPTTSSTNLHGDQVVIALPTNGNKLGNGSAVSSPTTPTTANGWIPNRQNGTDTAHSSNSALRTTQC